MLNKVLKIETLGGFRLRFHFSDGSIGEHDFTDLVNRPGPMLEPLRDAVYFGRVGLDYGAPTWRNGYDMCPDWLRMLLEEAVELRIQADAK